MKRSSKNPRGLAAISDEEMWEEIRQAFAKPLLPEQPSLAMDFKVVGPPASAADIESLLGSCGGILPLPYLDFLRCSDGAAGCVSDDDGSYLTLWSSKEVAAKNVTLSVSQAVPGMLAIGSDGKDGWVGFVRAASPAPESWPVVRVRPEDAGGVELREIASSFQAWQRSNFQLWSDGFVCGGG
jgi:hypothetical protein